MKNNLPFLLIICVVLVSSGLLAQNVVNKSFKNVKKIKINTASGSCSLVKSKDATVTVDLQHTYEGDRYEPRMEMEGDRLVIKEVFHRNSASGSSNWKLAVPDGLPIQFSTGSGDLEVNDLSVDIDASTGSGDLIFNKVKGKVKGSTGSGDVELSYFTGDIQLNTGSGNMQIRNSGGDISLNCGSGNLKLSDNKAVISANTGSGSIDARNLVLEGSSKFNTGSGDAEISLSATPAYDLAVNSGSGDAQLNFNGNDVKGEVVMQANKKNGRIVAPFEFDKTEEVNNWGDNIMVKKTAVKGSSNTRILVSTGSGSAILRK
jgi:hypothetical protein